MSPLVSVVVPVYKVEKYIGTCIESIINQSYENLEIILVNDGSPDNSAVICQEYADKDNRIKLINQDNKGLASARNTGIKNATGEFIYFVDSDDCINTELISFVVGIAEKENANLVQIGLRDVLSDFMSYDEKINLDKYEIKRFSVIDGLYNLEKSKSKAEFDLCLRTTVVWTKLYRTAAFKSLLFPEGMRMHEDQMVAHRNIIAAGGMVFVDAPLYYYRQNEGSLIRVGWTTKRLSIMDCYDDRQKWIQKMNEPDKKSIADFVHERFLVCIIRNYNLADLRLKASEKKEVKKNLKHKFSQVLSDKKYDLALKKKLYFGLFNMCPALVLSVLRIHDKNK